MNNENKINVGQDTECIKFRKQKRLLMASLATFILALLFSIPLLVSKIISIRIVVGIFDISFGLATIYISMLWIKYWKSKGMM